MKEQDDDFNEWVDNFFDLDPMMLNIVYLLYEAYLNKQTTGIGLIVETEPPKKKYSKATIKEAKKLALDIVDCNAKSEGKEPISSNEIAELSLFLSEKGLQFKHKGDTI